MFFCCVFSSVCTFLAAKHEYGSLFICLVCISLEIGKTCLTYDVVENISEKKWVRSLVGVGFLIPMLVISCVGTRYCLALYGSAHQKKLEKSEEIEQSKKNDLVFKQYLARVDFINRQNALIESQNKAKISDYRKLLSLKHLSKSEAYPMPTLEPFIKIPKEPVIAMKKTKENFSHMHLIIAAILEFLGVSAGVQAALSRKKEVEQEKPKKKRCYRKMSYDDKLLAKINACIQQNDGKIGYLRLSKEVGIPANRAKIYLSNYRSSNMN